QFAFSDRGALVYIPGEIGSATPQRQVALVDRKGKIKPLDLPVAPYMFPRISPDGKQLAVVTGDDAYVYPLSATTSLRRLTFGGRNDGLVWSGDSEWLIMRSTRDGDAALFRQRADGNGLPERLTKVERGVQSHVPGVGYWSTQNQLI